MLWFLLGYLGQLRKINVECGSVTNFAVNIDPALMLLNDAKNGGQAATTRSRFAKSCPFAEPVGRQRSLSLDVNAVLRFKLIFVFQSFVGGFGDLNLPRLAR